MADPVTAFGAAAGAIQLADVALRASRDAYRFLSAIKKAEKDVQELRRSKCLRNTILIFRLRPDAEQPTALCDVESNVRNLRNYIDKVRKSKSAFEELKDVSETITRSLTGFHDDIRALKSILPAKPSPNLVEKIKWAYSKRKVAELTKRLNDRRIDVSIALEILGR